MPAISRCLAIFDLDGTLVDAFGDIHAAVNHALARHGLPTHELETIRGFVGNGLRTLCSRAIPADAQDLLDGVLAETRSYYAAHPVDFARPYPQARESIERLRGEGCSVAVLSNKTDALVQEVLHRLGLLAALDAAIGERRDLAIKPAPDGIEHLMARLPASVTVMVGDGLPDGLAAQNAGVPFVAALWGIGTREELESLATGGVAETLSEAGGMVLARAGDG